MFDAERAKVPRPSEGKALRRETASLAHLSSRLERALELAETIERVNNRLYHALTGESIPSDERPSVGQEEPAIIPLLLKVLNNINSTLSRAEETTVALERVLTHNSE